MSIENLSTLTLIDRVVFYTMFAAVKKVLKPKLENKINLKKEGKNYGM